MKTIKNYKPYPKSINEYNGITLYMSSDGQSDVLIIAGDELGFAGDLFESDGKQAMKSPLTHENADILRKLFPFTAPSRVLSKNRTVGLGDRLGIACPGHLRVFEKYDAFPILAQQSTRELHLTNRTYEEVLDCVTFAVFKDGFRKGFGADGDHLKTPGEVEYALRCGYTMITLDCSEHIHNDAAAMTDEQVALAYQKNDLLESIYLDKKFDLSDGVVLSFNALEFERMVMIYGDAIEFAVSIYNNYIKNGQVDFEISIDETQTATTPLQHFFVANELIRRGVSFATLAPRFCGEFQKGVDYIGDLGQFEREFSIHATIARYFDYKISIHSGSDKFSVFPIIGRLTRGRFHVKTAGTNWLEALKLIAIKNPDLYREIHAYALETFKEATKYYHVTTQLDKIPDVSSLNDQDLPGLFTQNDARQLNHITYGFILSAKNPDGSFRFRDRMYKVWGDNAEACAELIEGHIGRHLEMLYG